MYVFTGSFKYLLVLKALINTMSVKQDSSTEPYCFIKFILVNKMLNILDSNNKYKTMFFFKHRYGILMSILILQQGFTDEKTDTYNHHLRLILGLWRPHEQKTIIRPHLIYSCTPSLGQVNYKNKELFSVYN